MESKNYPKLPPKKTELDNKGLIFCLIGILFIMIIFFFFKFGGIMNFIQAI